VQWRVACALIERDWLLREANVWAKPNARPESARDRLAQRYEMLFCLVQQGARSPDVRVDGDTVWGVPAARSNFGHVAAGSLAMAERCIRAT